MHIVILFCTFFQAIYLGAADDKINDGGIISVLLKKISDLEERDRDFQRKIEEIDGLKERLDEAHKRLTNMQELEFRLQKAEQQIRRLLNRSYNNNADCKVNKSPLMKLFHTNGTHDKKDSNSSASFWIEPELSSIEAREDDIRVKIEELLAFKNRVQTADAAHTKTIRTASARKVAFSARFSSTPIQLLIGHPLVFDLVEINEGNGYDKVTGVFTCPISGMYFFYTNVLSHYGQSHEVETSIVLDGVVKGSTLAFKPDNYDQGSSATIIHCRTGQKVWIRVDDGSITYGDSDTSFSGFLLWEDTDAVNSN